MKYQFMEQQRRYHRVEKMARMLEVSRRGFYMWLKRQPRRREQEGLLLIAATFLKTPRTATVEVLDNEIFTIPGVIIGGQLDRSWRAAYRSEHRLAQCVNRAQLLESIRDVTEFRRRCRRRHVIALKVMVCNSLA